MSFHGRAIWYTERTGRSCIYCKASDSEKRLIAFGGVLYVPEVEQVDVQWNETTYERAWLCKECLQRAVEQVDADVSGYTLKSTDHPAWVMEEETLQRWAESTRKEKEAR